MTGVRPVAAALLALAGALCAASLSHAQLVDPGAYGRPPPARGAADPGDDATRVLRNQADMRAALEDLRTDVQVTQAKVDELTVQFAKILSEMQALRAALDGGPAGATARAKDPITFPALARPQPPKEQRARTSRRRSRRRAQAPAAPVPPPVLSAPSTAKPVETTAPPAPAVPPPAPAPSPPAAVQDPFPAYEAALNDYHAHNYALARAAFAEFLRQFPTSTYANNAQFYVGQSFYAEKNYQEAVEAYQVVLERYPRGPKVPSAMLKMGYAKQKLGEVEDAKRLLQLVIDSYPFSSEAQLARDRLNRI